MPKYNSEEFKFQKRHIFFIGGGLFTVILLLVIFWGGFGLNNAHEWQIVQSVMGDIKVRDEPGWYPKMFSHVWTYPRAIQQEYKAEDGNANNGDHVCRVTFNDGGNAYLSTVVRFQLPKTADMRLKLYKDFSANISNVTSSVQAHMVNCCKAAAPLMSSSEHQSARKAEYTQIVDDMLRNGIYEMRQIEKVIGDQAPLELKPGEVMTVMPKGQSITVLATEIVRDEKGQPIIAQVSPLKEYDIEVVQFSITGTKYDDETLKKFAAKQESFLRAEQAKADREQEVQQRLMIIEKGKRESAEAEAAANKEKMTATTNAERERQVAVTQAKQKAEVADQTKKEAEIKAQQMVSVAELKEKESAALARAAEQEAKAIETLAKAQETKIKLGGAITDKERILAEIARDRDVQVAKELSKIQVPGFLFMGNGQGGNNGLFDSLVNMRLLESTGILKPNDIRTTTQPVR